MKKRFTLFSICALLVFSLMQAQQPSRRLIPRGIEDLPANAVKLKDPNHKMPTAQSPVAQAYKEMASGRSLRLADNEVISEQPEGTVKYYQRSGGAYYSYWGYMFPSTQDGGIATLVFSEDGKTVWMKDPISTAALNTWMKGTVSDDGKTLTFPLYQTLYYYSSYGYGYMTGLVYYNPTTGSYSVATSKTQTTYTIGKDGKITHNDTYENSSGALYGLGLIWTDDKTWVGYIDYKTVMTVFEVPDPVVLPDGVESQTYALVYESNGYKYGKLVNVGFDGNDVYVGGACDYLPDTWFKGTISGSTLNVAKQYSGIYGSNIIYLLGGNTDEGTIDGDMSFSYDASEKTFSYGKSMIYNAGESEVNTLQSFGSPQFYPYTERAATPADPEVLEFYDNNDLSGYTYGKFYVPSFDTDGVYINSDELYYIIYTDDGEVFEFLPDEYGITEGMTEVPYSFTDNYDIGTAGTQIYFYQTGFSRIGIQTVYKGGGETHYSNVVWYDIKSDTPDQPSEKKQYMGIYKGDTNTLGNVGTSKAETYDVAMYVQDNSLKGMQVTGLRIPVQEGTTISSYKGWLSRELNLETVDGVKQASPDIVSAVGSPDGSWVDITFDKPYTIGLDGFYAGYTFTVDEVETEANKAPIVLTAEYNENGYWLHTSRSYRSWTNRSDVYSSSCAVLLVLEGDEVKEYAASFGDIDHIYAEAGTETEITLDVINHGVETVTSIEYEIEYNGETIVGGAKIDNLEGDYYGKSESINVTLPAVSETGDYPLTCTIVLVNSEENEDVYPYSESTVTVMGFIPVHRPLMEEYTGTWCGWCTRGLKALEIMNERHPEDFVAIAYHNSDPMEIMSSSDYPSSVSGFPGAYLDREVNVDPYYGTSDGTVLGIESDWTARKNSFTEADIFVEGVWANKLQKIVNVNSSVRFLSNYTNATYAIEYVLVGNDMYGDAGSNWDQSNYYASYASSYASEPYLSELTTLGSTISGYHFDDVVLRVSGKEGVSGSVPKTIEAGEYYKNSYKFVLNNVVNTSGESIIQDKSKLSVVAILIDTSTGRIVNCCKGNIYDEATGISSIDDNEKEIVSVTWYDMQGRKLQSKPTTGIAIKSMIYSDGTTATQKIMAK